jgi:hypothetical protein
VPLDHGHWLSASALLRRERRHRSDAGRDLINRTTTLALSPDGEWLYAAGNRALAFRLD